MKKKITIILLAAALVIASAGCANNTASNTDNSSQQTSTTDSSSGTSEETSKTEDESESESKNEDSTEDSKDLEENYTKYTLDGELTQHMIDMSRLNEGNKVRVANVIKKMKNGEEVTVGYIGGSITQGTSAGNELCYARLTTNYLEEMYPDAKINYVNAGIGATGSYIGVHRVTNDLLSHSPDLVFVEFSVNDTTEFTERNKESYDSLLRTIWNSSKNPAIITVATTQEDGTSFQEQHAEIVKHYDLPMISYRNTILDTIEHGDITWKDISGDNIHPNVPGHKIVAQLLKAYIADVDANLELLAHTHRDYAAVLENGHVVNHENIDGTIGFYKTSDWVENAPEEGIDRSKVAARLNGRIQINSIDETIREERTFDNEILDTSDYTATIKGSDTE